MILRIKEFMDGRNGSCTLHCTAQAFIIWRMEDDSTAAMDAVYLALESTASDAR
jgi:hypothetical protein